VRVLPSLKLFFVIAPHLKGTKTGKVKSELQKSFFRRSPYFDCKASKIVLSSTWTILEPLIFSHLFEKGRKMNDETSDEETKGERINK